MILAANHVGDAHLDVIDHHREVIERMAIGSEQHQIFNLGILALLRSIDKILKMSLALARNLQAHRKRLAGGRALVRLFLRDKSR